MISSGISFISILLAIAFVTLLERKLLRYSQIRKGPEITGSLGLLQPISDGLKLLVKIEINWGNKRIIIRAPTIILLTMFLFWVPLTNSIFQMNLGCVILLAIGSVSGLTVLFTGWLGGRSYSFMGGLRAAAQIISYEVVLSFFFFILCRIDWSISLFAFQIGFVRSLVSIGLILLLWLVTIIAETNRAPFDIREGESELVRGFNTEYSRVLFTTLFIAEYGMLAAYGLLSSHMFLGSWLGGAFFISACLWIRACFPRKRYDSLMALLWIYYFPLILLLMIFYIVGWMV